MAETAETAVSVTAPISRRWLARQFGRGPRALAGAVIVAFGVR